MKQRYFAISLFGGLSLLAGCDSSDDDANIEQSTSRVFEVQVTNVTAAQPASPMAVILHQSSYTAAREGQAVSEAVEQLAESGDASHLLDEASSLAEVYASAIGEGILPPGASESIELNLENTAEGTFHLTVLSMLVNTNDALAGTLAYPVPQLDVGESRVLTTGTWDAGTEANSESADSVPGPAADGGLREGFNAARDDIRDALHRHSGVVSYDDGLASSVLAEVHRWDNPALTLRITRLQ